MKKIIIAVSLIGVLAGCASQPNPHNIRASSLNDNCNPIERDLTTTWENRYYWCAPEYYKKQAVDLQKQIAYEHQMKLRAEEKARKAQAIEQARLQKEMRRASTYQTSPVFIEDTIQIKKETVDYTELQENIKVSTPSREVQLTTISQEKNTPISFNDPLRINFFTPVVHEQLKIQALVAQKPNSNFSLVGCSLPSESSNDVKERINSIKNSFKKYDYKGNLSVSESSCIGQFVLIQ